jgi:hypothetical protein
MTTPDELTLAVAKAVYLVVVCIGVVIYLAWVAARSPARLSRDKESYGKKTSY